MTIKSATALVTNAALDIGAAFTRELLKRDAKKIYAAAPRGVTLTLDPKIEALALDLANPRDMQAAIEKSHDVTLVVNTTGLPPLHHPLDAGLEELARQWLETGFYGVLRICRALAPTLGRNGGGSIINVLAISAWMNAGGIATYSALQAATWSLTHGLRSELAEYHVRLLTLHMGAARDVDVVAAHALDAFENGTEEAYSDRRKAEFFKL
jgi:NAD(P)-dependent dehydrogenase (short-subunit alcohol dehydrogenase family)